MGYGLNTGTPYGWALDKNLNFQRNKNKPLKVCSVYCLLFTVYCLLFTVYCLLSSLSIKTIQMHLAHDPDLVCVQVIVIEIRL